MPEPFPTTGWARIAGCASPTSWPTVIASTPMHTMR